jgi:hypothetical protein
VTRRCDSCCATFDGERWQKYCSTCWRERRRVDELAGEYHRGFLAGIAAAQRVDRPQVLRDDLLRRVIALCHPDRHPPERAAEANAITAELLELRAEAAA